jgi:hypothetical protein
VNALNNPEVGKYINEYFVASFQKVATFKIVGDQKQGGNVAAYFCAPDGRVLNVVAGPVDAATMLREAKWTVETAQKAIKDSKGDGVKFKEMIRKAHAQKLREDFGIVVEAVTFDPPDEQDANSALTYSDPSGRPLAPKLPPPPIDGPDVTLKDKQEAARSANGAFALSAKRGGRVWTNNVGRAHQLMSAHSLVKIEKVYGTVFENILGEKISTKPVEVEGPFSWIGKDGNRLRN